MPGVFFEFQTRPDVASGSLRRSGEVWGPLIAFRIGGNREADSFKKSPSSPPRLVSKSASTQNWRVGDRSLRKVRRYSPYWLVPRPVSLYPYFSDSRQRALIRAEGNMMIKSGHLSCGFSDQKIAVCRQDIPTCNLN